MAGQQQDLTQLERPEPLVRPPLVRPPPSAGRPYGCCWSTGSTSDSHPHHACRDPSAATVIDRRRVPPGRNPRAVRSPRVILLPAMGDLVTTRLALHPMTVSEAEQVVRARRTVTADGRPGTPPMGTSPLPGASWAPASRTPVIPGLSSAISQLENVDAIRQRFLMGRTAAGGRPLVSVTAMAAMA